MFSQLDRFLRSCSYCGRSSGSIDLLCEFCWDKLFLNKPHPVYVSVPIPILSLFTWTRFSDPRIEHVVRTFKTVRYLEAYKPLARELCYLSRDLKNTCFVPIPPSVEGTHDHAFFLSQALSKYSGRPMNSLLRWKFKGSSQKLKTREERMTVKMELIKPPPGSKVILVDDIVTTGATANAAFEILKEYANVELWTYACRPREILL